MNSSLFALDRMSIQEPFSGTSFDDVDEWLYCMKVAKNKYVKHYKIADKPELSPSLGEYRQAKAKIEQLKKERKDVLKKRNEASNNMIYKELNKQRDALDEKLQAENKYGEMCDLEHLTHDEWGWIAHNLFE